MTSDMVRPIQLMVDETHMGRRASGIERITAELFSPAAFPELQVTAARSGGSRPAMMVAQSVLNPLRAARDGSRIWVFPGYPPSPLFGFAARRAAMYVHDLFLLTRRAELNLSARLYMAMPFRRALRSFRAFLVNSEATATELKGHVSPDAAVVLYRPVVRNVFGLNPVAAKAPSDRRPIVVGALGTIEPRKNYAASVRICEALEERLGRPVELHIVGRRGWGEDYDALSREPAVTLHGFLDDEVMRQVVERFDLFLCTSHAEGLGLPLLEMQYAGLPVVAPDQPVFREVLGSSGCFVDPGDPRAAAEAIAARLSPERIGAASASARANIERWNRQASHDREQVLRLIESLAGGCSGAGAIGRPS